VSLPLTRARFLKLGLALPAPLLLSSCSGETSERASTLAPTPACDDGDGPTPPQTEGPFFTPDSPERVTLLEPGIEGTKLLLAGSVLAPDCTPVAGALLDFWHADADGAYDNEGYRLRGHQFADRQGRYRLETIVPGLYAGRTRHIHVKVQGPGEEVLTTQLYFPGEPHNEADGLFDPALVISVREDGGARAAGFDFVLDIG
jgi:protocatechuate 3,4-dioxygenase beta subunit